MNAPTPSPESARAELQAVIDAALDSETIYYRLPAAQMETGVELLVWLRWNAYQCLDVEGIFPLVNAAAEIVLELWFGQRKLTFYVEFDGAVHVIRTWGDSLDETDEPLYDPACRFDLLLWMEPEE